MRTELHLSSLIEPTRDLGRNSITRQERRKLPSHPAAGNGHTSDSVYAEGAPTRCSPPKAISAREAAAGVQEDESPGLRHSREDDEEGPGSRASKKPSIVIVHSRTVFRDCLAQCLEMAYVDHDILSYSSIAEWLKSKEPNARDAAVIIIVIDAVSESSAADLLSLETNAVTNPVVIVSDTNDLNHIIRVLKSGVRGYIPTSLSFNVAVEAVRLVKAGGVFIPASSIVPSGDEPIQAKNSALLTQRQMEVVEEIRHGKANKQIAYELNMSEHTVKVHLRHIMRKLKARNRTEVAVLSSSLLTGGKDIPRTEASVRPKDSMADDHGA
jgi:DNA-binding NarL/FixJ family response regulator